MEGCGRRRHLAVETNDLFCLLHAGAEQGGWGWGVCRSSMGRVTILTTVGLFPWKFGMAFGSEFSGVVQLLNKCCFNAVSPENIISKEDIFTF